MKSYDMVMQESNFDCGLASLMTVFNILKYNVSKEQILQHLKIGPNGIKAYDLVETSKKLGIKSFGVKSEIDNLTTNTPCIAHIIKDKNYFHYVVILSINKHKDIIELFDPSSGIEKITFREFDEISTKIFILFDKTNISKVKDDRFKKFLKEIFIDNKSILIKTVLLSFGLILFSLISNYYVVILLEFLNFGKITYLITIFIIFLSINLLKNIQNIFKNKIISKLNIRINRKINKKIINHIIYLPYQFYRTKTNGELINIVSDVENFKDIIIKIFVITFIDVVISLVIIIYLSIINIVYLYLLLLLSIILFIISLKYRNIYYDSFIKLKQKKIIFSSSLYETLEAFYTIKGLNIEKRLTNVLNKKYDDVLKSEKSFLLNTNTYKFLNDTIIDIFYLLVIFITAILVVNKNFYSLNIVIFSSFFYLFIGFISNIMELVVMIKVYRQSIIKVLDILDLKCEEFKDKTMGAINNIKLVDVSLSFDDVVLFDKINLEIKQNDKIFIMGKSGVGKSSLMKMLLKFLLPTSGKILYDNIDYEYLSLKFIRENIVYVSQNEYLFTDSIYNNLSMVTNSKKQIKKALNTCLLNETFKNNNIDDNFLLTDNGINLSGGERKQLTIARALIKAKSILILDEAFNEIDIKTERKILQNIFNNYQSLIVILISHRNSNCDLFNKSYNFNNGGIEDAKVN